MPDRSSRNWSPYRRAATDDQRSELTVRLPEPDAVDPQRDAWDPVTKVEYIATVTEAELAESLVLETRRQAMGSAGPVEESEGRDPD